MEQALQAAKIKSVARKIMTASKNSLIVHLRFLDTAINKLRLEPYEGYICVDGSCIRYDPIFVLQCYTHDKNLITRTYLHMILHCTFTHFYVGPRIDRDIWNIACDMAVENILDQLSISEPYLEIAQEPEREQEMALIREQIPNPTAERIYRYLLDQDLKEERLQNLFQLFAADDHTIWYEEKEERPVELQKPQQPKEQMERQEKSEEQADQLADQETSEESPVETSAEEEPSEEGQQSTDSQEKREEASDASQEQKEEFEEPDTPDDPDSGREMDREMQQLQEEWKNITRHMQLDLETFSKEKGSSLGDLLLNIRNVTRERYDYTAFLKKFAAMGEKMRVNDDEFDYVYYTYGLQVYDNMPLVEPLEYKETNVVKEFVIAIDTSFSVHGDEVQSFIRKTYNILKATESFASKINLHILQCDTEVRYDKKITTQAELDKYMKDMLLYGFGGTDFRPVFTYVDQLIAEKEFTNLKGLIYFTDGFGTFPERPPAYKTAFAFVSDDVMFDPVVPPWAIKLILDPNDIKEEER